MRGKQVEIQAVPLHLQKTSFFFSDSCHNLSFRFLDIFGTVLTATNLSLLGTLGKR